LELTKHEGHDPLVAGVAVRHDPMHEFHRASKRGAHADCRGLLVPSPVVPRAGGVRSSIESSPHDICPPTAAGRSASCTAGPAETMYSAGFCWGFDLLRVESWARALVLEGLKRGYSYQPDRCTSCLGCLRRVRGDRVAHSAEGEWADHLGLGMGLHSSLGQYGSTGGSGVSRQDTAVGPAIRTVFSPLLGQPPQFYTSRSIAAPMDRRRPRG
jgi:hypothetical protein